ncbi:MAG TPA: NUDIX hydrolase [Methylomirabilota bacterium]|jgi:ADP-ribose pyrophosphatase|nr:NUDIX hydrolase [Methylomirabilota bacterium]
MDTPLEWRAVTTAYRDVLVSARGEELRWLVNTERIHDPATGLTVTRSIIRHPGVAVIVPFVADDRIVLLRQYRYTIDGELWELPAGTLHGREEAGRVVATETAEACARRELLEECGYVAARWEKVAAWYAMPGGNDQIVHLFFAGGLGAGAQSLDEGELIREVRAFDASVLEGMIARGEIRDAKSLVGLFYALARRPGGVRLG